MPNLLKIHSMTKWYFDLKSKGLCPVCRLETDQSKYVLCELCREYKSKYNLAKYYEKKAKANANKRIVLSLSLVADRG